MHRTQLQFRNNLTYSNAGSPMNRSIVRKENIFQNLSQIGDLHSKFNARIKSTEPAKPLKTNGFAHKAQIQLRTALKFPSIKVTSEPTDLGKAAQNRSLNRSNINEEPTVDSLTESVLRNHKSYRASYAKNKSVSENPKILVSKFSPMVLTPTDSKKDLMSLSNINEKLTSSETDRFDSNTALGNEILATADKSMIFILQI